MRAFLMLAAVTLFAPARVSAQDYRVEFEGRPISRIQAAFLAAQEPRTLSAEESFKYAVRIVERQGKYYWASRDMIELTRIESGSYITHLARNGSGYIRVAVPMMLDMRDQLPDAQRHKEIGYTEHLLSQFESLAYLGNRLGAR